MDEQPPSTSQSKGWLNKITQAFLVEPKTKEELVSLLRDSQLQNLFNADALAMIEGVLQVAEMQVRDIMIPRSQMVILSKDKGLDALLPVVVESGHSRFPVVGEDRDEVMGILLAKDLLREYVRQSDEEFDMKEFLRPALFVPESKRLDVLLREFQSSRNHMAIVVDEYGGVAGLVTIEDVLEQIVGEIDDEHDFDEESNILKHEDHYMVKALTDIDEFNDVLETEFSDEEIDTVGGLVTQQFGHVPRRGESVRIDGLRFEVVRSDKRKIHLLQVSRVVS